MFAHFRRNKLRALLTLGSVFMAVLIFGFLRTFIVGMETSLAECNANRIISASKLSLFAHLPKSLEPEIAEMAAGKASITTFTWYGGIYIDADPSHYWGRFGTDPVSFRKVYGPDLILDDAAWQRWAELRQGCIIGADLARDESLKIGDRVHITGNIFSGEIDLEVVGIYRSKVRSFDQKTLFFNWDYMNETSKQAGGRTNCVSTYCLLLNDAQESAALSQKIDTAFENSPHRTMTQTERAFQAQFNSMWGNLPLFFGILGGVVLLACLMVTSNTMMLNARERIQETGVLKTLGFTKGTLLVLTLTESLLLCLIGGGLAMLIVNAADGAILMFVIASVPASTIWLGLGIAAALGLISGLFPALLVSRLEIVDALRRRA
jgi:putative ABC transport system permease protein